MQRKIKIVDFDYYAPCECGRRKLEIYKEDVRVPDVYTLWCPQCETARGTEYSVRMLIFFHVQQYLRDHTHNSEDTIGKAAERITNFLKAFNVY